MTEVRRKKVVKSLSLLMGVLAVVGLFQVGSAVIEIPDCSSSGCPALDSLEGYRPPEAPTIYDRDGRLVAHLNGMTRIGVPLEKMPRTLVDGYVAVEDRRFWRHGGIDLKGIVRAAVVNLAHLEILEGASTITMQLARTLWMPGLGDMGRWRRKAVEVRLARIIEGRLSKAQILELYLNRIYMGEGVFGVPAASQHYFGKPVSLLSTGEMATLIGLTKTPARYNPRFHPARAEGRRNVVLQVLEREGVIDARELDAARGHRVTAIPAEEAPDPSRSSYYSAAVMRELQELIPDREAWDGLRVFTAYDPMVQKAAERRLIQGLRAIERGDYGAFHGSVPDDSLPPAQGVASPYLQGAVVVVDNFSGAIRALVGGRSYSHSEFDRAMQARRPAGSAFKPIVWAAALDQADLSLASRVRTAPIQLETPDGPWAPTDAQSEGHPMTLKAALAQSSNLAAVRIGNEVGVRRVISFAHSLGIRGSLPPYPSLFIGSADVRLVDLTAAYAAFPNGGRRVPPHLIQRVEDRDGEVLFQRIGASESPLDPRTAFLTRRALEAVVNSGTGWRVREAGYRGGAGGKTGTTDGARDAWFIGFTPGLSAGVWIGFDRPATVVKGGSGGDLAAPIWGGLMADVHQGKRPRWPKESRPLGLLERAIDPTTGFLSTESCPSAKEVLEYFVPGTEPDSLCEILERESSRPRIVGFR